MVREGLAAKRKRLCVVAPSLIDGTAASRGVKRFEVSLHRVPRFLVDEIKLVYPEIFVLENAKEKRQGVRRQEEEEEEKRRRELGERTTTSSASSVLERSGARGLWHSSTSSSSAVVGREEEEGEEEERFLMAIPVFLVADFDIIERNTRTEAERLRLWCAFQHFANVFKAMLGQRDPIALSDYSDLDGSAATTRRTGTIYNEVQSCKALLGYRIKLCECVPIVSHPTYGWDHLVVHTVVAWCKVGDARAVLGSLIEGYGRSVGVDEGAGGGGGGTVAGGGAGGGGGGGEGRAASATPAATAAAAAAAAVAAATAAAAAAAAAATTERTTPRPAQAAKV